MANHRKLPMLLASETVLAPSLRIRHMPGLEVNCIPGVPQLIDAPARERNCLSVEWYYSYQ